MVVQKYNDREVVHFSDVLLVQQVLENKFVFPLEFPHVNIYSCAKIQAVLELVHSYVNLRLKDNFDISRLVQDLRFDQILSIFSRELADFFDQAHYRNERVDQGPDSERRILNFYFVIDLPQDLGRAFVRT